jgi:hypothetical protein
MTEREAAGLQQGKQVEITYLGERHVVTVVANTIADRWGEQVTVQFTSGAVLALHYKDVRRIAAQ